MNWRTKKLLASIGYNPLSRTYYIDRVVDGRLYQLYHYSKQTVENYVKRKSSIRKRRYKQWT